MTTVLTSRSDSVVHYLNPIALLRNLWQHRDLVGQFTRRDIEGRYRGSFLGILWSFITPLIMLLIYTFVFGVVFKSRWSGTGGGQTGLSEFAIILFCGLTTFNIFGEVVSRGAGLVVGVPNYVKKVVFPLEILPISALGAALFHAGISLTILLLAHLLLGGAIYWTLLLVPVVLLPLVMLTLGLAWLLASLGVFIRDIGYTVTLVVQVFFFLTPIFYQLEQIPQPYQRIAQLNPLANVVDHMRRVVLWGQTPDWPSYVMWLLIGGVAMILGYAWFMKTRKAFADVL